MYSFKPLTAMLAATITSKGQITIPASIRQALNLGAGDRIAFSETSPGCFVFKPEQKTTVTALKGIFGATQKSVSIAQMNAAIAQRGSSAMAATKPNAKPSHK